MSNKRPLSWSAALRDLKADREKPAAIREERLRVTSEALTAWRGKSGTRRVFIVLGLDATELRDRLGSEPAVVVAVHRAVAGLITNHHAGIVSAAPARTAAARSAALGFNELHLHRLAKDADERAAIVADLTPAAAAVEAV